MRGLSFILAIIGGILAFSDTSVGWGVTLIVIGFIMNILHHLFNAFIDHNNRQK